MCKSIRPVLAALAMFGFAAHAAQVPVSDFIQRPPIQYPVISPDGHELAVVMPLSGDSTDARAAIAILRLPDLKPVIRLQMTPRLRPMDIRWVGDHRLAVALARNEGTLEDSQQTVEIVAIDDDGSGKRVLYSVRRSFFKSEELGNARLLDVPRGLADIVGTPAPLNGHLFVNVSSIPDESIRGIWQHGQSILYDVDSRNGRARIIGTIGHAGMLLLPSGDVARIAVGQDPQMHAAVFTSTDGKAWVRLPENVVGDVFEPLRISRDGTRVFALSSMNSGPNALIKMNLDGSDRTTLASDAVSSASGVMWDPVADTPIAAIFKAGGVPAVKFIGVGKYARSMHSLAVEYPTEVAQLLDGSADGSKLLVDIHSDRNPGVIALYDSAAGRLTPLYRELPSIDPRNMPQRMAIQFRDRVGLDVHGFVTVPNNVPLKNLPLVLIPHGGPIGVDDTWFFDPWAALLANRGYAVLQVNFRGSSGRGMRFQQSGFREFGTGIQDDLIDGVKWAIAQGYVDPGRICVFGASFGGYSALMQPILAPKLYKCAIDYAGVYDWRLVTQKSDASDDVYGQRYFTQAVGTASDAYSISPASELGKLNVPVLIAHGEDDQRVPFKNATELRAALQAVGKPYEWLAEPGELHGFMSDKNNEQLFTMITAFLAKYIGPGAMPADSAVTPPQH